MYGRRRAIERMRNKVTLRLEFFSRRCSQIKRTRKYATAKPKPSWGNIPPEIQQAVVNYLPFKDRISMRDVSRSDRALIDSSPLILSNFTITIEESYIAYQATVANSRNDKVTRKFFSTSEGVAMMTRSSYVILPAFRNFSSAAVNNILRIFSNEKIEIKELRIKTVDDDSITEFMKRRFLTTLDERMRSIPYYLKAKKLTFHFYNVEEDHVLGVLRRMAPSYLTFLGLSSRNLNVKHEIGQLASLVQFDHLEQFVSNVKVNLYQKLSHMKYAYSGVIGLRPNLVNGLIEVFRRKAEFKEHRYSCRIDHPMRLWRDIQDSDVLEKPEYPYRQYTMPERDEILQVQVSDTQVIFIAKLQTEVTPEM